MGGTLLPPHSGDFPWTPGWGSSQIPCTHMLTSMHAHEHVHAPPPPIPRALACHPEPCRIRSLGTLRNSLGGGSKLMSHVTPSVYKRVGFGPENTSSGIRLGANIQIWRGFACKPEFLVKRLEGVEVLSLIPLWWQLARPESGSPLKFKRCSLQFTTALQPQI